MSNLEIIDQELIPVYKTDTGERMVEARELHEFLEVATPFRKWIKRRIKNYGFEEGLDFWTYLSESGGGRPSKEYLLTLDMGKELGMVERNEQGKIIRKYFIELEKRFKKQNQPATIEDLIIRQAQSMKQLKQKTKQIESKQQKQEQELDDMKDTLIADTDDWRGWINRKIRGICENSGDYANKYKESYEELEKRASCRLGIRLDNLKERKKKAGASKTEINKTRKLDVIEQDDRLKEIYTSIVKEIYIKYK